MHKYWAKWLICTKPVVFFVAALPRSHRPPPTSNLLRHHKYTHTHTFQLVSVSNPPMSVSMLKAPFNAADQLQALAQCRAHVAPRRLPRRRISGVSFSAPPRTPVVAVLDRVAAADGEQSRLAVAGSGSLADRLRMGSLTEDGLSYKERFIVRCYEVGINKTATVETIANLLQVSLFVYYHCRISQLNLPIIVV